MSDGIEKVIPKDTAMLGRKKNDSVIWRGLTVTFNFFYETPAMVFGLVIAGVVAHLFVPQLACTCYMLAGSSLLSKLIMKISSTRGFKSFENIEIWSWNLKKKYPYIQAIAMSICLVVSYFFPVIAIFLALPIGIYNGIVFEIEFCKKLQRVHQQKMEHQQSNVAMDIIVR